MYVGAYERQDKWRILQYALSSYVYNRSLFAVFTEVVYIYKLSIVSKIGELIDWIVG